MRLCVCLIGIYLSLFSFGYAFSSSDDTRIMVSDIEQMNFHSQASQDEFVYTLLYALLGKEDQGYYLEIGAGDPIYINNSYFLEKELGWYGVSIDISPVHNWYSKRNNPLLTEDALKSDYHALLRSFPQFIDYLSLDIDAHYDTCLKQIPFDEHIFKIITIEHDFYRFGDLYRKEERKILTSLGYHLLCSDVSNKGFTFEDWWIHPSAFPTRVFSTLTSLDLDAKEHKEILQIIQTLMSSPTL